MLRLRIWQYSMGIVAKNWSWIWKGKPKSENSYLSHNKILCGKNLIYIKSIL